MTPGEIVEAFMQQVWNEHDPEAVGAPISFTGTAVWEVRDGKLAHNWVERSAARVVGG
jgi:hypothetical protein